MARSLAAPGGLRRLFTTSSFFPPPNAAAAESRVEPEPNTNLFVSAFGRVKIFGLQSSLHTLFTLEEMVVDDCGLYVENRLTINSGLSKRTTTEKLREAFSQFGEVVHARVVSDRISGYSKGFGFVRYATLEDAAKGVEGMNGKYLDGWVIFAEYARPRPPPTSPPNNGFP